MTRTPQNMFSIPGSTTYAGSYPDDAGQTQSDGGGLFSQLARQIQAQQASQYPAIALPPAANPMAGINPMYTRQTPQNSLAPMGMYQAYKQTGQMPATGAPSGQTAMGAK